MKRKREVFDNDKEVKVSVEEGVKGRCREGRRGEDSFHERGR